MGIQLIEIDYSYSKLCYVSLPEAYKDYKELLSRCNYVVQNVIARTITRAPGKKGRVGKVKKITFCVELL
jgi:hypothetical protein